MDNTSTIIQTPVTDIKVEIQHMLQYMYNNGILLPSGLSNYCLDNSYPPGGDSNVIISDYNAMVTVISPVTPETIKFIDGAMNNNPSTSFLNIPTASKFIILSIIALLTIIGTSLLPQVNEKNEEMGILDNSGLDLLFNIIHIISSALLGVMFYILKDLRDKVNQFTLKKINLVEYNFTILIGIISGFIFSELFTFSNNILGNSIVLHRMTLALIGGFSGDAIFSVLQGLVNKIKMLFTV